MKTVCGIFIEELSKHRITPGVLHCRSGEVINAFFVSLKRKIMVGKLAPMGVDKCFYE